MSKISSLLQVSEDEIKAVSLQLVYFNRNISDPNSVFIYDLWHAQKSFINHV